MINDYRDYINNNQKHFVNYIVSLDGASIKIEYELFIEQYINRLPEKQKEFYIDSLNKLTTKESSKKQREKPPQPKTHAFSNLFKSTKNKLNDIASKAVHTPDKFGRSSI